MAITAQDVMKLRKMTSAGMMDCKKNIVTDVRSLKSGIVSENVLLTGLAGLGGDLLLDSVTVRALAGLQAFG